MFSVLKGAAFVRDGSAEIVDSSVWALLILKVNLPA